jgi:hypothetical protein
VFIPVPFKEVMRKMLPNEKVKNGKKKTTPEDESESPTTATTMEDNPLLSHKTRKVKA